MAADGLAVAVALLDDHADVGFHQLGDVHDLWTRGRGAIIRLMKTMACESEPLTDYKNDFVADVTLNA